MDKDARDFLSPTELADYLGIPMGTVYQWNSKGTGPRRIAVGKHVRYRLVDVEEWLEANASARQGAA